MCGLPHADLVLDLLTAQQYREVMVFAEREPLPSRQAALLTAFQTMQLARIHGAKGELKLSTFLLDLDSAEAHDEEQSPEQMELSFNRFNRMRREARQ